jgi:Pyruvate/2-oxoacid:ferredoxin oxidoreductase gamma subunit
MTPPSTTSRTLLANARILACDRDRDERPFDGDILIEGRRIARVSHGRLGIDPAGTRVVDLGAATVGSDDADAYLSGDFLQAAAARHLTRIRPGHTVVVVDPELTPTAAMLQGGSAPPDIEALKAAITERAASPATAESPATRVAFVAAKRIAEAVFSDHLLANVILAGASCQLGGLPGSLDDVAQAMSRQGKSAAVNCEAFEWGRWAVHDPDAVEAALRGLASSAPASPFEPSTRSLTAAGQLVSSAGLPLAWPGWPVAMMAALRPGVPGPGEDEAVAWHAAGRLRLGPGPPPGADADRRVRAADRGCRRPALRRCRAAGPVRPVRQGLRPGQGGRRDAMAASGRRLARSHTRPGTGR